MSWWNSAFDQGVVGGMQLSAKTVATFGGDVQVKNDGQTSRQKVRPRSLRTSYADPLCEPGR